MAFELVFTKKAEKDLDKLDRNAVIFILKWLDKNINGCSDPRVHGKALKGDLSEYWRYRVGNYRVICLIDDGKMVVLAISIGDRKNAYK